jgi:hypothetical protein
VTKELNGEICFKEQKFYSSSIINQDYIFTIANLKNEKGSYSEMMSPNQIDSMIKNKLNDITGLNISEIEQKKSRNGAPSYHYKKNLLTSSCSISHHGNYGAYSFVIA